ncbi:phosphotriesterase [Gryllotalpicola reticulitermitis]|uniref:Phosphotriesterase n=1 Tax=Gryllotalpicola reticulitermitis TaxID=1184153 RepID=A0ABV8Q100_9MICO
MSSAAARVRTVTGDLDAAELGVTDYHEHLFQVSPLLPGDELDDEAAAELEARELRACGFDAIVDPTPIGLGRRPEAQARVAAATGLRVVAATGVHRDDHYGPDHWIGTMTEEALAERFVRELTAGLPLSDVPGTDRAGAAESAVAPDGTPVRAGLIKTGIDYWRITPREHVVLAAAAHAHERTNAPVMVHLEQGSAGFEVLRLLDELGVPADAVVLAHVDRNPDPGLHAELAAAGAYLGYDGWGRYKDWPDSVLIDCFVAAAEAGASDRLLVGGDVARRSRFRAYGGMPGLAYVGERVMPRLRTLAGPELTDAATRRNPARLLARF